MSTHLSKLSFFSFLSHRVLWGIISCVFLVFLSACGYHLHTTLPSVLGDGTKTLKVKTIDYPTLDAWLPYDIRSRLRDEINARNLAVWVDSGPADYEISINVTSFRSNSWVHNEYDATVLFDNSLVIESIVYDGLTNKEIWRSGKLAYSERSEISDLRSSSKDLITQTIRLLTEKLRNSF